MMMRKENKKKPAASKQLYFVATVLRNVLLLNVHLMQDENSPVSI